MVQLQYTVAAAAETLQEYWPKNYYRYCKSTNFGVLLYLANCVFSLIFVAANIYVDRTLHRRAAGRRQL